MLNQSPYLKCEHCGILYKETDVQEIIESATRSQYDLNANLYCVRCVDEYNIKSSLHHVKDVNEQDKNIFDPRGRVNKLELNNKLTGNKIEDNSL